MAVAAEAPPLSSPAPDRRTQAHSHASPHPSSVALFWSDRKSPGPPAQGDEPLARSQSIIAAGGRREASRAAKSEKNSQKTCSQCAATMALTIGQQSGSNVSRPSMGSERCTRSCWPASLSVRSSRQSVTRRLVNGGLLQSTQPSRTVEGQRQNYRAADGVQTPPRPTATRCILKTRRAANPRPAATLQIQDPQQRAANPRR